MGGVVVAFVFAAAKWANQPKLPPADWNYNLAAMRYA